MNTSNLLPALHLFQGSPILGIKLGKKIIGHLDLHAKCTYKQIIQKTFINIPINSHFYLFSNEFISRFEMCKSNYTWRRKWGQFTNLNVLSHVRVRFQSIIIVLFCCYFFPFMIVTFLFLISQPHWAKDNSIISSSSSDSQCHCNPLSLQTSY